MKNSQFLLKSINPQGLQAYINLEYIFPMKYTLKFVIKHLRKSDIIFANS